MTQNEIIDTIITLFTADLNTTLTAAGLDPMDDIVADAPTPDADKKLCLVFPGAYSNDDSTLSVGLFIQFQLPGIITATDYQDTLIPYLLTTLNPGRFELITRNISIMPFNSGELDSGGSSLVVCDLTLSGDLDSCD